MFYSLAHPELIDLLGAAEQLLALTGEAVELCPRYGSSSNNDIRFGTGQTTTEEVAP